MRETLLGIINDPDRVITENIEEKYIADEHGTLRGEASSFLYRRRK